MRNYMLGPPPGPGGNNTSIHGMVACGASAAAHHCCGAVPRHKPHRQQETQTHADSWRNKPHRRLETQKSTQKARDTDPRRQLETRSHQTAGDSHARAQGAQEAAGSLKRRRAATQATIIPILNGTGVCT
eukprot:351328-Chlamydomonas_euryale.AAC.7